MSIKKMNKISIIGKLDKQDEILDLIISKGFVQLNDLSNLADEEEFKDTLVKSDSNNKRVETNKKLEQIELAINNIKKFKKVKKGLFSQKNFYQNLSKEEAQKLYKKVEILNDLAKNIDILNQQNQELTNEKIDLFPWKQLEIPSENDSFNVILGFIPKK